jgi:hypothetical protein
MSAPAIIRVLVIGYGDIGSNLLRWLTSEQYRQRVSTSLLIRPSSLATSDLTKRALLERYRAAGVTCIAGDVSDSAQQLSPIFRGFDVVVSTLGIDSLPADEKLIEVAKASGIRTFIPSMFGFDYSTPGMNLTILPAGAKEAVAQKLIVSGVGYVITSVGLFSEYLLSPFSGLELDNGILKVPFSLDTQLTTTTLDTIGHSIAELIVQDVRNERVRLASDTVTFEQLARAVEKATGKTLRRVVESETELDAQIAANPADPLPRYHKWWGLGKGMAWEKDTSWNTTHGIPPTDIDTIAAEFYAQPENKVQRQG